MKLASTSSVAQQLMALERKGVLFRDPHHPAPTGSGPRGCTTWAAGAWRRSTYCSSDGSPPTHPCSPRR
ncbi:LexA family protein [Streptomyces mirabilis]|uniref:LexA family protein n=1 Tax=Streptomyces mirabilis TaxID=68239 RepID=UPI003649962E